MRCLLLLTALAACLQAGRATSILDYLWDWSDDTAQGLEQRETQSPDSGETSRKCSCSGPACNCCVDFNLTFIDLGGPGCVTMEYISPEDGIAVNVSYGDSLLHNESVKGANPEPSCMGILSEIAQLCAHFVDLAPTRDGLRWCLQIEPVFLGEVQTEYHVGCFRMAPGGMDLDPTYNYTKSTAEASSTDAPDEDVADTTEQTNEEALLAVVSESAEQSIAFFSNLLSMALGKDTATNSSSSSSPTAPTAAEGEASPPASAAARVARKNHSVHSAINDVK